MDDRAPKSGHGSLAASPARLLVGRVALVTGGARRVGAAIVRMLAAEGALVAIHYQSSAREAASLARDLRQKGARVLTLQADLREPAQVDGLFTALERQLGPAGILVNNAAVYERCALEDLGVELWDRVMETNLRAAYLCIRRALAGMRSLGRGDVVNIGDLAGLQAWPDHAALCASKAGLLALTRCLARELGPAIRVNAIAPGIVLHRDSVLPEERARLEARIPAGRSGSPEDVAQALRFLLSCPKINRAVLPVDGGRLAGQAVRWLAGRRG